MKKIYVFFAMILTFSLQACAQEQEKWVEDTHYKVISDQATEKPVVTEYFSFWCPHCYNFEPIVAQIKAKLDEGTEFKKVHVNFMRFTGPEVQDAATKAMLVGRTMGKEVEMNQAIFNYIHVQRQPITGLTELQSIFLANGVTNEEFNKMASSFGVNSQLKQNNKSLADYREHLSGVPNFIVNGKYQATFTRDMTMDDIVELIVWLSKQP
ncbi:thiol:disulfide interchange protein DsbA/DsbL [Aliiglaciecola sp. M165]|uniref:thiol:disulfide interchange protein DsbA/DsbL n=1 Tax=Aliiglaciecola sp. M165 TaxID=2593649 RepID=UPI00117F29AA|nr:thiol:disulfide interchange protein DsbA/DsbL [Aliiglaciecola sp. M165]TRY32017.1 thiol:disulfide interchange protein DsbA/DsbL [Aliiglaciecola sp. M165]